MSVGLAEMIILVVLRVARIFRAAMPPELGTTLFIVLENSYSIIRRM